MQSQSRLLYFFFSPSQVSLKLFHMSLYHRSTWISASLSVNLAHFWGHWLLFILFVWRMWLFFPHTCVLSACLTSFVYSEAVSMHFCPSLTPNSTSIDHNWLQKLLLKGIHGPRVTFTSWRSFFVVSTSSDQVAKDVWSERRGHGGETMRRWLMSVTCWPSV